LVETGFPVDLLRWCCKLRLSWCCKDSPIGVVNYGSPLGSAIVQGLPEFRKGFLTLKKSFRNVRASIELREFTELEGSLIWTGLQEFRVLPYLMDFLNLWGSLNSGGPPGFLKAS
jgi:hypothetical protein